MTYHFAYGANMSRAVMRRHAAEARAIGPAILPDHRFVITGDGYASVELARAQSVYGVLWRIAPRDRVTLDNWENVAGGLYRANTLAVRRKRCLVPALVYFARPKGEGHPKPGYLELVLAAAREWNLPQSYIETLEDWLVRHPSAGGVRKIGEFL